MSGECLPAAVPATASAGRMYFNIVIAAVSWMES